jgi:hypothetical protein
MAFNGFGMISLCGIEPKFIQQLESGKGFAEISRDEYPVARRCSAS